MQVAHWPLLIVCYVAFEIKGQKKATAAFKGVWPLFDLRFRRPCDKLLTGAMSYLHANFEQNWLINTIDTFKGRCGLCLAFDCKDYLTNH